MKPTALLAAAAILLLVGSTHAFAPSASGRTGGFSCPIVFLQHSEANGPAEYGSGKTKNEIMLECLATYKQRVGNTFVPRSHFEGTHFLGRWLADQRTAAERGTIDPFTKSRLDELGVFGGPERVLSEQEKFDRMVNLLIVYKEREGNTFVPRDHAESGKFLGRWLADQREAASAGTLPPNFRSKLDELGVFTHRTQVVTEEEKFTRMVDILASYKQRVGNTFVPAHHVEDGKFLGRWLAEQKKLVEKGTLDERYKRRLDELGVFGDVSVEKPALPAKKREEAVDVIQAAGVDVDESNLILPLPDEDDEAVVAVGARLDALEAEGASIESAVPSSGPVSVQAAAATRVEPRKNKGFAKDPSEKISSARNKRASSELLPAYDGSTVGTLITADSGASTTGNDKLSQMIGLLTTYKERVGNVLVPRTHVEGGEFLGRWLAEQKKAAKEGAIDALTKRRLEDLGVFNVPTQVMTEEAKFNQMADILASYKDRIGNTFVPAHHVEGGKFLGRWLAEQKKAVEKGTLDAKYKRRLDELGVFGEAFHAAMFEDDAYKPTLPTEEEEEVAVDAATTYAAAEALIEPTPAAASDALIPAADGGSAASSAGSKMVGLLATYKERVGSVIVPRTHVEDGEFLGRWLAEQKRAAKEGTIDDITKRRLEALGVFDGLSKIVTEDEKLNKMLYLLATYKDREGNVLVPRTHMEDGEFLGRWLAEQKKDANEGTIDEHTKRLLEELGVFAVSSKAMTEEEKFNRMIDLLSAYKEREGNTFVPRDHIEGAKFLGHWLGDQKKAAVDGTLDESFKRRLEELGVLF